MNWEEISSFFVTNWQPIFSAFLSVVAVIIVLIKKRPSASSLVQFIRFIICYYLPSFINKAEKSGKTGSFKFAYVLGECMHLLHKLVKTSEEDDKEAKDAFTDAIESILSTPQKKGDT